MVDSARKLLDGLDRRRFLEASGVGAAALIFGAGPYTAKSRPRARFAANPFSLGVASGDPLPDGVVLWTRLAPDPLSFDPDKPGGLGPETVEVSWEIAEDEAFGKVVRKGTATARPELAHSVHIEAEGLRPAREYFYRFRTGGDISPVGRTKTAPAAGGRQVNFAFVSCQQYEHGYYPAYRHLAEEDLDLILHLGDYIYEYGTDEYLSPDGNVRHHDSAEIKTLADYRHRHALYRTDQDLRAAHASAPWIVTWDDHEVEDNYANDISENAGDDPAVFLKRRAAAYQAYYENMPLRKSAVPSGPDMLLYRKISYGGLVDFNVLDTRQYRDDQASGDGIKPPSDASKDPARSLTGDAQEQWLIGNLTASPAVWKIIPQQVFFARQDNTAGSGETYNMDAWDGYEGNRDRIMDAIVTRKIANPVVLSGDVHASWANDLKADFADPDSATVGVEFVGTSVTSGGNGSDTRDDTAAILKENPHIKFFNNYRGYVRCSATQDAFTADYRVVPTVATRDAEIHTRASFRTAAGRPGLTQTADNPLPTGTKKSTETEKTRLESQRG